MVESKLRKTCSSLPKREEVRQMPIRSSEIIRNRQRGLEKYPQRGEKSRIPHFAEIMADGLTESAIAALLLDKTAGKGVCKSSEGFVLIC